MTAAAAVHSRVAAGFDLVADAFRRNLAEHGEHGVAFASVVEGEPVVDLWGATPRPRRSGRGGGTPPGLVFTTR